MNFIAPINLRRNLKECNVIAILIDENIIVNILDPFIPCFSGIHIQIKNKKGGVFSTIVF